MASPKSFEKGPLGAFVENVGADDEIEATIETIPLPVQSPGANPFPPWQAIELCEEQRGRFEIGKNDVGPERRRDSAGHPHAATEIQNAKPACLSHA